MNTDARALIYTLALSALVGASGCSSGVVSHASIRETPPAPTHTLELINATAYNTITPHTLVSEDIVAPVEFAGLDAGWFAIVVADQILLNGEPIRASSGSERHAIAMWGLNLDDPTARGTSERPLQWHYTNSVFWLTDTGAIAALKDVGVDARPASIMTTRLPPAKNDVHEGATAVSMTALGFSAQAIIDDPYAAGTPIAPFDRDAVHWSCSDAGQGIASARYHGQEASQLAGRMVFSDMHNSEFIALFPEEVAFVSTSIGHVELRFASILPAEARLGLAAVLID